MIQVNELKPILEKLSKGAFFTATNVKHNGEVRKYCCRLGVTKYLRGGHIPYNAAEKNLLTVYDVNAKDYRNINCNTLKYLRVRGKELVKDSKLQP